jgi:outer membrane protein, heavy metal efflux system
MRILVQIGEVEKMAAENFVSIHPASRDCRGGSIAAILGLLLWALPAAAQGPVRVTLDQAIQMAIEHNHALKAARTLVPQSKAQEITAGLRPNIVLSADSQFLPLFNPSNFTGDTINTFSQFDVGVGYLFERGGKRRRRIEAAKDQTAVTQSQVTDAERALSLSVGQQFINALLAESNLDFALAALKSFQNTVDISNERFRAGDMSEGDLLKIKLQLLQFQSDVAAAKIARVQALAGLRQLLGYESVPVDFDVQGELAYQPVPQRREDLEAQALKQRPDFLAAQQGVTAAQSQHTLAQANGKRDFNLAFNYTHLSAMNLGTFFFNMELPIFNRNQGEIARTNFAIGQAQELRSEASEQVVTDVTNAYESAHTSGQIVELYTGGYLQQAQESRDISEYAYKRGAASLLDFLDAERNYRSNQLAYRQSLAAYMMALEQLRASVGTRSLP